MLLQDRWADVSMFISVDITAAPYVQIFGIKKSIIQKLIKIALC